MAEKKIEAISYQLPQEAFDEGNGWLDFDKVRSLANKSFMTNVISAAVFGISYGIPHFFGRNVLMMASLFALSGALTNWIAVYMLFEKIPGLYGSGIIAVQFHQFKESIRTLVMENFFTEANFLKVAQHTMSHRLPPEVLLDKVDFNKVFNGFLSVIKNSQYGGMFTLFGGEKVLEPLRKPFKAEFERQASEIISSFDVASLLQNDDGFKAFRSKIDIMVDATLNELTPHRVKEIVEEMIRSHLGWLVLWGGVFGALIGFVGAVLF